MKQKVGFIGTGVMGSSIIKHLLKRGYVVRVYSRTKEKTNELIKLGAIWCESPGMVAQESNVIFTMVGYPKDVEEVYYGENGIFQHPQKNKIVVDLTTSTPTLAKKIGDTAAKHEMSSLDAPVSGGDIGAQKGALTLMVGGDKDAFEKVKPLFECFSNSIEYHGKHGNGQHVKMANQIMIAGTMTGMTEMIVYAQEAELDLEKVFKTLNGGAAQNWSLENYAPRILKKDYSPGFFIKHFLKDLSIALDEAEKLEIELPATKMAKDLYEKLSKNGYSDYGTQALIKLWEKQII